MSEKISLDSSEHIKVIPFIGIIIRQLNSLNCFYVVIVMILRLLDKMTFLRHLFG